MILICWCVVISHCLKPVYIYLCVSTCTIIPQMLCKHWRKASSNKKRSRTACLHHTEWGMLLYTYCALSHKRRPILITYTRSCCVLALHVLHVRLASTQTTCIGCSERVCMHWGIPAANRQRIIVISERCTIWRHNMSSSVSTRDDTPPPSR